VPLYFFEFERHQNIVLTIEPYKAYSVRIA
jgi:hypothetical protein